MTGKEMADTLDERNFYLAHGAQEEESIATRNLHPAAATSQQFEIDAFRNGSRFLTRCARNGNGRQSPRTRMPRFHTSASLFPKR